MRYRHVLFFDTIADALDAQVWVEDHIEGATYLGLSNDGETGIIDLSFYTADILSKEQQRSLKRIVPDMTSALFNGEEEEVMQ